MKIKQADQQINKLIHKESTRQRTSLQLIPSENYTSKAVRQAVGSVLMHKYSEGQVSKRYYEGNKYIDEIEELCKRRALKAFNLSGDDWGVNCQALSGSIANLAVYNAIIKPKNKIMSMYLYDGGHLSHGWKFKDRKTTLSSKIYKSVYYHVDKKTEVFNYDSIREIAKSEKPQLIISGGTSYPREIDHKQLSQIANEIGAYYMADIAHEAGLVIGKAHSSPFPYADVVTMTTHKTLRGPKGALIIAKKKLQDQIDKSVFPGIQGGPFNNNIAGIAVALEESLTKKFKQYSQKTVENAKLLAEYLKNQGYRLVSGGTDKHLILIDLENKASAKYVAKALNEAGLVVNKNTIPNEPNSPSNPSGIRIGTPTVTTRGMGQPEMKKIADWFDQVVDITRQNSDLKLEEFLTTIKKLDTIKDIRKDIKNLCGKFPLLN